jgi:hypothetical protein
LREWGFGVWGLWRFKGTRRHVYDDISPQCERHRRRAKLAAHTNTFKAARQVSSHALPPPARRIFAVFIFHLSATLCRRNVRRKVRYCYEFFFLGFLLFFFFFFFLNASCNPVRYILHDVFFLSGFFSSLHLERSWSLLLLITIAM